MTTDILWNTLIHVEHTLLRNVAALHLPCNEQHFAATIFGGHKILALVNNYFIFANTSPTEVAFIGWRNVLWRTDIHVRDV